MRRCPATLGLIVACLLGVLVAEALGGSTDPAVLSRLGARRSLMGFPEENWRLIASCFLHYGWFHLLSNSVMLGFCGYWLEPRLGWWRMLFLFLWSGWAANLIAAEYQKRGMGLGASGAVLAWVGCLFLLVILESQAFDPEDRRRLLPCLVVGIVLTLGPMKLYTFIDHTAHQAGLMLGALYALSLKLGPKVGAGRVEAVLLALTLAASLNRGPTLGI